MIANLYQINKLTDDMSEFCFKTEHRANFLPGQFALLDFPDIQGSRGYSMSNLPNEDNQWHFIIKRMPDGKGTSFLFDTFEIGQSVEMDGPYGLAFFKSEIPRDIVLIGGGSGLSPIMSIAKAAANNHSVTKQKIHMFYGGRGPKDICTIDLVNSNEHLKKRLTCYNAISDPELNKDGEWDGECCFIHELVAKELGDTLPQHEFYFCGPPPMTDAITRMLMMEYKVPFDQIHYDRFY
jgi:toluene monooxygenase electron transfer component